MVVTCLIINSLFVLIGVDLPSSKVASAVKHYYEMLSSFSPCDSGCHCYSWRPETTSYNTGKELLDQDERFVVECTESLSVDWRWLLNCLEDVTMHLPLNTTDLFVSHFPVFKIKCGNKPSKIAQLNTKNERPSLARLLTLTIDNCDISDLPQIPFMERHFHPSK